MDCQITHHERNETFRCLPPLVVLVSPDRTLHPRCDHISTTDVPVLLIYPLVRYLLFVSIGCFDVVAHLR